MLAYEFYFRNKIKGDELIGILPERRRKPERVTQESIMKWAKIVFSETLDVKNIYFVSISLERSMTGFYFPRP
jgi:hypothetical protein